MDTDRSHRRFELILGLCFTAVFLSLGFSPTDRFDWLVENLLVFALLLGLALGWRWFRFSPASLALIGLFVCLHEVGAHYTYAKVPYDAWFDAASGRSLGGLLGWRRNQFDRLVHLAYGLLLAYPVREFLVRLVGLRGFWSYVLALDFILASSAVYELMEWVGGDLLGGVQSQAFVGTQGDPWDAQKDMALAAFGGLCSLLLIALSHPWRRSVAIRRLERA